MTAIDDQTLLMGDFDIDRSLLAGFRLVAVAGRDPAAANVVRLPDGRVLTASDGATAVVEAAGRAALQVDISELVRADGGPTCLSIRRR